MMGRFKKMLAFITIYFFNLFPVKHNKIILFSYYGGQYGCNPKYISDYIITHYPNDTFDVVWAFHDVKTRNYLVNFRKVKTMSLRYFYELCTAKVIITNYRTTDLFIKRKKQYYIQTWHSSLRLKQIEKDAEHTLPPTYVNMAKRDSLKCDLLLSGSKYSTTIFKRAFWYDGEIFEHGTPRNDVLIEGDVHKRNEIRDKLKIPHETKVLLYAPTFRENGHTDQYQLEWTKLLKTLKDKFGSEWVILSKLHPHLNSKSKSIMGEAHVIDVTSYDDIQELLLVADLLISDYSSLIFDYALTNRPCFLYVPDYDVYTKEDRKLYFGLAELPFIYAKTIGDLIDKINQVDDVEYKQNLKRFMARIGSYEHGEACECLLKHIHVVCFKPERSKVHETI